MTEKQITTLLYFSQNYSLNKIAKKRKVTIQTIKTQLNNLKKNYPEYYNNAVSMRNTNKRLKFGLQHPLSISDIEEERIKFIQT